ncbi:PepSY domain-containing protein [Geminocystis sp. NIES-3709]|uniref:PepSY domain-containing protein n=1 Tax=Geminocystis sp. NIES-3709 TaxID=1617448 RepID=UPI0005FC8462|nr:PepSY domain-containing protein [Geminocystis sp. NIES-3709]BAQ64297.1 hypothetical protein GM3709_1062 [Geminocystis sp. NIES-3709]
MSLRHQFRTIHRKIAPIVFIPLILIAFTGISFYIFTNWFGFSEEKGEIFLVIHQGEFLGDQLKPIYVVLAGLGLLGMIVTGLVIHPLFKDKSLAKITQNFNQRKFHILGSIILFFPLTISVITGVSYRVARSYFNLPKEQAEIFLEIHQGEYLGSFLQSIYIILVGIGLISLLITGIKMTSIFRPRRQLTNNNK